MPKAIRVGTTAMSRGARSAADTFSGRQFVILSNDEPPEPGVLPPIGSRADVVEKLAGRNTGAGCADAPDVLYGPGFRIELAPSQDPINQMLVTITEEEIGWMVLQRLIRDFGWKLLDPATGRELGVKSDGPAE